MGPFQSVPTKFGRDDVIIEQQSSSGHSGKRDEICIIEWTVKKELKYSKNINANCTVNMICERMKVSDDGT